MYTNSILTVTHSLQLQRLHIVVYQHVVIQAISCSTCVDSLLVAIPKARHQHALIVVVLILHGHMHKLISFLVYKHLVT